MNIEILVLGTDINAYYMARCYHELYHKKVTIIGMQKMAFTSYTNICDVIYYDNLYDNDTFKESLEKYAKEKDLKDQKILLVATSDTYAKIVSENKEFLEKYYVFNYPTIDIINNFLVKDVFYTVYKDYGLDFPNTIIYNCSEEDIPKVEFSYPLIIKPGNAINYNKHHFTGQKKVFKVHDEKEYYDTIKLIKDSGYVNNLIIQEFIPGDDSNLFDSVFYCSSGCVASVATFAQIALQEHTPTAVGNCTVLVNGYNEYGGTKEVVEKLKNFLETIKYNGFAEVDLKYDPRDKKFKVLEINPRQGRSSYYLTPCGANLIKCMIDDLFYHEQKEFKLLTTVYALSFVPKKVIKKYIYNENLKRMVLQLFKQKKVCNPLKYKGDKHLKRMAYLFVRNINYIKKYKKNEF
jgi:D-aspartate ligase